MQYRASFGKGKAFESMPYGMSQVQGLADAVFQRILFHDVFFYLYGATYH